MVTIAVVDVVVCVAAWNMAAGVVGVFVAGEERDDAAEPGHVDVVAVVVNA